MKKKYLIIFFNYFMDRGYFEEERFEGTKEEAEKYAKSKAYDKTETFNNCKCHVVEL